MTAQQQNSVAFPLFEACGRKLRQNGEQSVIACGRWMGRSLLERSSGRIDGIRDIFLHGPQPNKTIKLETSLHCDTTIAQRIAGLVPSQIRNTAKQPMHPCRPNYFYDGIRSAPIRRGQHNDTVAKRTLFAIAATRCETGHIRQFIFTAIGRYQPAGRFEDKTSDCKYDGPVNGSPNGRRQGRWSYRQPPRIRRNWRIVGGRWAPCRIAELEMFKKTGTRPEANSKSSVLREHPFSAISNPQPSINCAATLHPANSGAEPPFSPRAIRATGCSQLRPARSR